MSDTTNTLVERNDHALQTADDTAVVNGPLAMALQAMKHGMSIADMRDMLNLQKEWEANEARKAFVAAMAEFKKNPPTILKEKRVYFESAKGVTDYMHASIGEVCEKIVTAAADHGFSHRWVPGTGDNGRQVVTCVITHRLGHAEETRLEALKDDTGGKNAIQAMVSANTYLQRHSLLMAFGFATRDLPDDDGRGTGNGDDAGVGGKGISDYNAAENLRYWNDLAKKCKTLTDLNSTRQSAARDFNQAADVDGWASHKAFVEDCRVTLAAAQGRQA